MRVKGSYWIKEAVPRLADDSFKMRSYVLLLAALSGAVTASKECSPFPSKESSIYEFLTQSNMSIQCPCVKASTSRMLPSRHSKDI